MKRAILFLPAFLSIVARSHAECGCGNGSTSNGTITGSLNIIYSDATTNIGASPGTGVKLLTIEQPVTVSSDKSQGGLGLFALLGEPGTDPVTGTRPTTAPPIKTFVKGGSGSPLQYGTVNAGLQIEASSTDVYHPVELTYESDTADYREHMMVTPPAGHYMLSSLVAKETGGSWSSAPNQIISDPHKDGQTATFLRMVFVSERGDPHHEPGDFTFPVLSQEEIYDGTTSLGDLSTAFTVWLGNDQDTGSKQGRSWGRLVARPGLLSDVGAHQLRFVTSYAPVDTGSPVLVDEIIAPTGRTYQIKTAAVLLDVREVTSGGLRKVTIRLTTHADAGTPDGNGVYPEPATPKYGTLQFEAVTPPEGFAWKTIFRQFAPGANPSSATPVAVNEYSVEEIVADTQRRVTTVRSSLDTEVVENISLQISGVGEYGNARMETRHTHLGATASGSLLATSRAIYELTARGDQLFRSETGSSDGDALPADSWADSDCLEWTNYTYSSTNGTRLLTENSRGQWSEQYFSQTPFQGTAPSYYGTLTEGDRHYARVSPLLGKGSGVTDNIATGHVAISRTSPVICNCAGSGATKLAVTTVSEEYRQSKLVSLATTAATTTGSGTSARTQLTTARRTDPAATTPTSLSTVSKLWPLDYANGSEPATSKRARAESVTGPEATPRKLRAVKDATNAQLLEKKQWTAPSSGTVTSLYAQSRTDPSGRTVSSITGKDDLTGSTTNPTGTTISTITTAYSNDGTNPAIRITTATRDSLQISQEKYDPGLRKRTEISAEGVTTETLSDALGRTTSVTRTTAAGVPGTVTYYDYEARTGGGTVQRIRQGTAAGTIVVSEQTADNAGRTVTSKDGAGLTTTYEYSVNEADEAVTTETLPSGATRITATGADGETVNITGTAAVAQTFENIIVGQSSPADSVTPPSWITTAQSLTGFRRRSVYTGSAREEHTVTDGLGRTVAVWGSGREELHVYNSSGQLIRIEYGPAVVGGTTTVRVPVLYEYDALGRTVKSGYSLDGNGTLDAGSGSGTDRVSLTAYSLVQFGGAGPWWEKTENQYYKNNGSGADVITASTTYNLLKPDSSTGLLSETRTVSADGAEQRTQTVINTTTLERKTLTTRPGASSNTATTVSKNGVLFSSNTLSVQEPVIYYYDQYGRSTGQSDPQTARSTVTEYNGVGQVSHTVDLAGNSTFYTYHPAGDDGAGQLKKVTHAGGAYTSYEYDLHGRVTAQTGDADYPVRYTYDADDGWMTSMKTYRDSTGDGNPLTGTIDDEDYESVTTWGYDAATGLVTDKTDAAGKATSYTYWTGTTLLKERLWARFVTGTTRVTTTYDYDGAGQLVSTSYNDGITPPVTRTYDRAGREATRTDAAGITTFTRTNGGFVTSEAITQEESGPNFLAGWTLTRTLETYGRPSGVDGSWSGGILSANSGCVTAAYAYDSTTGRLDTVTNNSKAVVFSYTANSDQPYQRQFKSDATTVVFEQEYGYDEAGRLNAALTRDTSPATTHAAYYYQYDNRNRRTQALREDGVQWNYGYDTRGQVTSAKMKTGADYLAGRQYEYTYDAIGNRLTAKSGGNTSGTSLRTASYTRNSLNQYTAITNPQTFDVNGLDTNPNDIWVMIDPVYPSSPDSIQPATTGVTGRWRKEMTASSADDSKPMWETVTVKEYTIVKNSGTVRLPPINQAPAYDDDGNLLSDGTWTYTWDAENRLIQMEMPALPQGTGAPPARQQVSFAYDGLSRRISKLVSSYDGTAWTTLGTWLYSWDGWNCILRCYDSGEGLAWDQAYVWGPDIGGARLPSSPDFLQSAGGVGGLLIENKNLGSSQLARRLVGYDGNGNVTTLADGANGQLWALYEYDAFGNETRHHNAVGSHADDNPFRFSTKPTDDETGLLYYGYRYYSPGLGRWISRDPIGEEGGVNLNCFTDNNMIMQCDALGMQSGPGKKPQNKPRVPPQPSVVKKQSKAIRVETKVAEKNLNGCGGYDMEFRFFLPGRAKCNGHIVQKVHAIHEITICGQKAPDPVQSADVTYWEAWPIKAGEDEWSVQKKSFGATDTVHAEPIDKVCGKRTIDTEIRFYCDNDAPGLGGSLITSEGLQSHELPISRNWSFGDAQMANPDPNMPGGHPWSGQLPSTKIEPNWWREAKGEFQPSFNKIAARWKCCGGKDDFYTLDPEKL